MTGLFYGVYLRRIDTCVVVVSSNHHIFVVTAASVPHIITTALAKLCSRESCSLVTMARLASLACIAVILVGATTASAVQMLNPYIEAKASYTKLAASQASALYQINVPGSTAAGESYATPPLLVRSVLQACCQARLAKVPGVR